MKCKNQSIKLLIIFVLSSIIISCKKQCPRTIIGTQMYGITKDSTGNLVFDDYFRTDSFANDLHLFVNLLNIGRSEEHTFELQSQR